MKDILTLIIISSLSSALPAAAFESQLSTVTLNGDIGVVVGGRLFADSTDSMVRLQLWTTHEAPSIIDEAIQLVISNESSEQAFVLDFEDSHRLYWDEIVNPFVSVHADNPVVRDPLIGPARWNVYSATVNDTQGLFQLDASVRFRRTLGGAPALSSGTLALVPEPTACWLMIMGLVAVSRSRGRTNRSTGVAVGSVF